MEALRWFPRAMLTEKQRKDLHIAIWEYLREQGAEFQKSAQAFSEDAGLTGQATENGSATTGLLEKKWTSVVRLQKKILELEGKLTTAEQELKTGGRPGKAMMNGGGSRNLPRAPPKYALTGHRGPVTCLAMHPVFGVLVSGSEDASIKTWDLESGEFERTLKGHTNVIQSLAFNKAGSLLASSSSDMSIKLWDFGGGSYDCLKTLRGHDHNISAVTFLPSGDYLVSCSRDNTIKCWEVSTGYCNRTFTGHTDWVRCIAVNAEGTLLASGGTDQSIIIWNIHSGTPTSTLRDHTNVVEAVAFPGEGVEVSLDGAVHVKSPVGGHKTEYLVSGSRDKTIKLWNVGSGQCIATFNEHDNWVRSVCFHPSGHYIISASEDRSIRIVDLSKGRSIRVLDEAHSHFVTSVCQHNTLPYLVSGSVDKEIHVWDCR